MQSEFRSLPLVGIPNSEMFVSERDLGSMELNLYVRPRLEFEDDCGNATQVQASKQEEEKEKNNCKLLASKLRIKLPALGEFRTEEEDDDGFKTPTSSDHQIPVVLPCPPAPKKPKSHSSAKRKSSQRRVLLDLSNEMESLFPPTLLSDLGAKIKKAKLGNDPK